MRENHRPTLPKWPFYFGDIFLVSIAITLAFQNDGPLTAWQFFWCFLTLTAGAILFATPFIIEFKGHIKLGQSHDSGLSRELLKRVEAALYEIQDMRESVLQQSNKHSVANTMLETQLKNVDARLIKLTELQRSLSDEIQNIIQAPKQLSLEHEETLLSLNNKIDQVLESQTSTEELEAFTLQLQELLTQLETRTTGATKPSSSATTTPATNPQQPTRTTTGQVTRTPEGKQVFDIQNLTQSPQDHFLEETNKAFPTGSEILSDPSFNLNVNSAKNEFQGLIPSKKPNPKEMFESGRPLKEWAIQKEAAIADTHEVTKQTSTPTQQDTTSSSLETIDMPLFDEKQKTLVNQTRTTFVANVLTGIGKKPFLRGDAPGLSWEKGVPMDFVEIGKWQWSTTDSNTNNSQYRFEVYKNDETPADGGPITVDAGATFEMSPHFSS